MAFLAALPYRLSCIVRRFVTRGSACGSVVTSLAGARYNRFPAARWLVKVRGSLQTSPLLIYTWFVNCRLTD
jgi:hypothetical protein